MIFAPPVAQEGAQSRDKYTLAMRMLDFPNTPNLTAEEWVPQDLATFATWNWNLQKALRRVQDAGRRDG